MLNNFSLNDAQLAAVLDTEGAVLVIAGAGSGKTRVLTARICHLIDKGVDPYNIVAITFTNKAAAEMKERISSSSNLANFVWASTFHSMCAKILRIDADKLGYSQNFTIYTDIESERVVKRICADVGADPKEKGDYLWHISKAKTLALDPQEYHEEIRADVANANMITRIYAAYEKELKQCDAMDFDDLLLKTVKLFEECPDVLTKYQNRFKYICVDEFQDTNKLQYKLVRLLAGLHGNLFAVGDEDQNIYSWRGAEIRNILCFQKDFPGAKMYKLEQNYRSTKSILDAANNVIKNNSARNEKALWSQVDIGNCVEYYEAPSDRDEASYVSRQINYLASRGENYRGMAILVRVNSLTRSFEEDLNLHGIPYKVFGGFRFYERKEIKDALGYVRLAINPSDNDSLLRIINYPKRGIGGTAVEEIKAAAEARGISMYSVVLNPQYLSAATAKKVSVFTGVMEDLRKNLSIMQPVEYIKYVIFKSGLQDSLVASGDKDDLNRLDNIMELANSVSGFVEDNIDATIIDFMQSVALVSDSDEMDGDNYVTVATIHAVKGLEFDTVFIVGLEEGVFPVQRSINDGDIEEERRLMYVAITRARKRVYALSARSRFRFGTVVYNPKSRFVAEMRGEKQSVRSTRASVASSEAGQRNFYQQAKTAVMQSAMQSSSFAQSKRSNSGNNNFDAFVKDAIVEHNKFGRGIIISTTGEGEDKTAAIAFKGLGVKRFSLAVAINSIKIVKD